MISAPEPRSLPIEARSSTRTPILVLLAIACGPVLSTQGNAQEAFPPLTIHELGEGVRFGVFGARPSTPAPTLIVFATGLEEMENTRIYSDVGRFLAPHGWLTVAIDPPCHGTDRREGEPAALEGWAHRVRNGTDLIKPFTDRATKVLDRLVAEAYTDPRRVAVSGTSRGGFCALHFAAAEPRVRCVTCVSPVTDPLVLREFHGIDRLAVAPLQVSVIAERLADRAVWISIGNHDERVGTDECIMAARILVEAHRRRASGNTPSDPKRAGQYPIELVVGPSQGHQAIQNAYALGAQFVLRFVAGE